MLIKEIKDTLTHTGFMLGTFVLFLSGLYISFSISGNEFDISAYFQFFYQVFIFLFSFLMGISLFSSEIRNNGFEYLLTLPYTRSKLLLTKIFPRLIMLIILYLGYMVIFALSTTKPFLITPELFNSLYFSLFFISTSLSVLRGNFVANSLVTMMMFSVYIVAANLVAWMVAVKYYGVQVGFRLSVFTIDAIYPFNKGVVPVLAGLLSIPFIASLFYGFKQYDIRSSKRYLKRFITLFIPLFLIGIVLSYIVLNNSIQPYYESYYLTEEGMVFKSNMAKTFLLENGEETEIEGFSPFWFRAYEWKDSIYSITSLKWNSDGKVIKFNKKTRNIEDIYDPGKTIYLASHMYGYKNHLLFTEKSGKRDLRKREGGEFIFINTENSEITRVKSLYKFARFCGVVEVDNKRIWIGSYINKGGLSVFTVDESGNYQNIVRSSLRPVYSNGILVTYNKGYFEFGKISGSGYEILKRLKAERSDFYNHNFSGNDLNKSDFKYLYGRKYKDEKIEKFVMLDLENLSISTFDPGDIERGFIRRGPYGNAYFTKFSDNDPVELDKIYKFEGKSLVLLKDFKGVEWSLNSDFRHIKNGFIIKEGKKVRIFKYPDLKVLKF